MPLNIYNKRVEINVFLLIEVAHILCVALVAPCLIIFIFYVLILGLKIDCIANFDHTRCRDDDSCLSVECEFVQWRRGGGRKIENKSENKILHLKSR